MSIASELEDLATNLTNANTAIVGKGGTASTTGFSGLANAVDTIETGGGGGGLPDDPETNYGAVMYYSRWANEYSATNTSNCTVNSIDQSKLAAWISNHGLTAPIDFNYNWEGQWEVMAEWEPITINNLKTETGIDATLIDPEAMYGSFRIIYGTIVDTTSPITVGTLTQAEYNGLGGSSSSATRSCSVAGVQVPVAAFVRFVFGSVPTSAPQNFLAKSGVESISDFPQVTGGFVINDGFMEWCTNFNSPIAGRGSLKITGERFLAGCINFNSEISMSFSQLSTRFMEGCMRFNKPLSPFTGITSVPDNFMNLCISYSGPVDFPDATTIGDSFFRVWTTYTYQSEYRTAVGFVVGTYGRGISLNLPKVTTIGSGFFVDMADFNTPWQLPALQTMGSNFFGQEYDVSPSEMQYDIQLPQTLTSMGQRSFRNLFYSITIDVGSLDPEAVLPASANRDYIFTAYKDNDGNRPNTTPAYSTGIKIKGANRAAWLAALPNRTDVKPWRKLVDAGA